MNESWPLVYILLLNWNTGKHTLACLDSLQAVSYPNYRVVVLDNASSDGSPDTIAAAYPNVPLLRMPRNLGFTGANNMGFQYALEQGAAFVYLLNTDTHVAPDFLTEAVRTATREESIGIIGSKVLHADRPDTLQFAGLRANLTLGHHGRAFGYDEIDRGQYDHVADIDLVGGCAMMVSRACLEAVGGLDDWFFAFHEDFDLCLRARAAGFRVVMSPLSRVWHEGGGAMGGAASPGHIYYSVRNALRLLQRHKPVDNVVMNTFRIGCVISAHAAQVALNRPSLAAARAIIAGTRDYFHGIGGPRPSR